MSAPACVSAPISESARESTTSSMAESIAAPGMFRERRIALAHLANAELLLRVTSLAGRERMIEIDVLLHLIEVEHRRLHLDLGFPSMFQYCIESLEYSRATAARRIRVARCLRDFPRVATLLEAGEVTLSTVYLVARVLTPKNETTVLGRVCRRTEAEVESILVEFGGRLPKLKERVEKVRSIADPECSQRGTDPVGSQPTLAVLDANPGANPSVESAVRTNGDSDASSAVPAEARSAAASDRTPGANPAPRSGDNSSANPTVEPNARQDAPVDYRLTITVDASVMKKLKRAQALQSRGSAGKATFAETLNAALDRYLFENCPTERDKRRRARKKQQEANKSATQSSRTSGETRPASSTNSQEPPNGSPKRAPVSQAIRDAVFTRDRGRCTFVGPDGRRCTATDNIEIDHRHPSALGGDSSMNNLRCLCRAHNQREADHLFGKDWMDSHRSRGRRKSSARPKGRQGRESRGSRRGLEPREDSEGLEGREGPAGRKPREAEKVAGSLVAPNGKDWSQTETTKQLDLEKLPKVRAPVPKLDCDER